MAVSAFISADWKKDCKRKIPLNGKDVLFTVLTVIKHGQRWDFKERLSEIKRSTFERVVEKYMIAISDYLYDQCVKHVEEK